MLRLPALLFGGRSWRLPLASANAAELWEILLIDRAEDRSARLEQAIERDPGFALWAFCRMSLDGARQASDAPTLAAWLAKSTIDLLDGVQGEDQPDESSPTIVQQVADAWEAARQSDHGIAFHSPLPDWLRNAIAADSERHESHQEAPADALLAERLFPALLCRFVRLERLETAFHAQLEAEKLEAMAEFAAGAGHEINNPIAVIAGRAQLFLRGERDPERRRELAVMNGQAMRVYEMISDMMLFARPPKPKLARCDVSLTIAKATAELAAEAAARHVELEIAAGDEPMLVTADPDQLAVVLRSLIENALEAIAHGGRVQVSARRADATAGDQIEIVVSDSGPGIPPDVLRRLFDPFYSGRAAGRGLGLGLSKCWRIVAIHGGRIDVESEIDRGSTFTVRLPAAGLASQG